MELAVEEEGVVVGGGPLDEGPGSVDGGAAVGELSGAAEEGEGEDGGGVGVRGEDELLEEEWGHWEGLEEGEGGVGAGEGVDEGEGTGSGAEGEGSVRGADELVGFGDGEGVGFVRVWEVEDGEVGGFGRVLECEPGGLEGEVAGVGGGGGAPGGAY